MKTINRRESPRIEINLRCHVTSPAIWNNAATYTGNISRSGLLIVWREVDLSLPLPNIGQILTVEIELPANHGFGQKCIHCQGLVVRVGADGTDGMRVALRVNYMDFRALHDKIRAYQAVQPAVSTWMA
jgi:hypothetical protein